MHGICFDYDLQDWFDFSIPNTTIENDFISNSLLEEINFSIKPSAKVVWIGNCPTKNYSIKSKKGQSWELVNFTFYDKKGDFSVSFNKSEGDWLFEMLTKLAVSNAKQMTFQELKTDFEFHFDDFELFWFSKPVSKMKEFGLLLL